MGNKFIQRAGSFEVEMSTHGAPPNGNIKLFRSWGLGDQEFTNCHLEDLHDLRYCLDRIIAQVEADMR